MFTLAWSATACGSGRLISNIESQLAATVNRPLPQAVADLISAAKINRNDLAGIDFGARLRYLPHRLSFAASLEPQT